MGLMFGCEKLMKTTKNNFFKLTDCPDNVLKDAIKHSKGIKKIFANAADKFKNLTKGQKTAAKVGIGLLFVAGSIGAYSIGKTAGKKTFQEEMSRLTAIMCNIFNIFLYTKYFTNTDAGTTPVKNYIEINY